MLYNLCYMNESAQKSSEKYPITSSIHPIKLKRFQNIIKSFSIIRHIRNSFSKTY